MGLQSDLMSNAVLFVVSRIELLCKALNMKIRNVRMLASLGVQVIVLKFTLVN